MFADGAPQCEPAILLESSAQKLIDAGVDVLRSSCGVRTGVSYAAVCGGPSGDILVHEIRSVNIRDANRLGFQEISILVDASAGTGYQLVDCDTGM